MGSQYPGNRRSDEQLDSILFETADWTVNGRNGQVLCTAPSLRGVLDRAADFEAVGTAVIALCRLPADNIIVFAAQAERMQKLLVGREVSALLGDRTLDDAGVAVGGPL
jgi:hypothetical protein